MATSDLKEFWKIFAALDPYVDNCPPNNRLEQMVPKSPEKRADYRIQ